MSVSMVETNLVFLSLTFWSFSTPLLAVFAAFAFSSATDSRMGQYLSPKVSRARMTPRFRRT